MSATKRLVASVLLAPFVILVVGIGGCEARKAYYDWQVRKMCEKDGGVTVLERIVVSADQARELPRVANFLGVSPESLAKEGEPAFSRMRRVQLREGALSIVRYEQDILRRSDRRVVAHAITYTRAGGDFPTYAHPSSFTCPDFRLTYAGSHAIYRLEEAKK